MSNKLTAVTITDADIRELRRIAESTDDDGVVELDGKHTIFSGEVIDLCDVALGHHPPGYLTCTAARARCAAILNARAHISRKNY